MPKTTSFYNSLKKLVSYEIHLINFRGKAKVCPTQAALLLYCSLAPGPGAVAPSLVDLGLFSRRFGPMGGSSDVSDLKRATLR
jgi:hypothetical protein